MPKNRPANFTIVLLSSLYFSQGLPSGLLAHALPALLREHQVPLQYIGYLKLLAVPWMFKFVWAPYVDRYHFRRTGPHRSWILPMQTLVIAALLALSVLSPEIIFSGYLPHFFLLLLLLNFCSATQDIATDGLAVKLLPSRWRGLGNSIQVSGYKLGLIVGGSLLLLSIDHFGWSTSFLGLAIILALLTLPILLLRESPHSNERIANTTAPAASPKPMGFDTLWSSYRDFFRQPGIKSWLLVILTYKAGDSLGSGMVKPMLVDAGFSLSAIGSVTLTASLAGMAAAVLGGLLYYRWGAKITLLCFGLMQAAGIGAFTLIARGYTDLPTLYSVTIFEQVADGMSTVVLFALMMEQCRPNHEGADYSIQACFQVLLAGFIGAASGWIASNVGYSQHFLMAASLGLLALVPAWYYLQFKLPEKAPDLTSKTKPQAASSA